jgi:hypothetical protein
VGRSPWTAADARVGPLRRLAQYLGRVREAGQGTDKSPLIRLRPELRLQDFDECMFIFFFLNQSLAEKLHSINIYANEYKVAEIPNGGFSIDRTPVK